MGQAIFHNASKYKTTWSFKCRNKNVKFTLEMVQEIKEQIKAFCNLRFTEDELNYLKSISWLDESYVDYLHNFAPNFKHIFIGMDSECGELIVRELPTTYDESEFWWIRCDLTYDDYVYDDDEEDEENED